MKKISEIWMGHLHVQNVQPASAEMNNSDKESECRKKHIETYCFWDDPYNDLGLDVSFASSLQLQPQTGNSTSMLLKIPISSSMLFFQVLYVDFIVKLIQPSHGILFLSGFHITQATVK